MAAGEADLPGHGYVYEEIGECLLMQGDLEAARPHFAEAYRLLSRDRWLTAGELARLARLQALGQGAGGG